MKQHVRAALFLKTNLGCQHICNKNCCLVHDSLLPDAMQSHAAVRYPHSEIILLGDSTLLRKWGVGRHSVKAYHISVHSLPALWFFAISLVMRKIGVLRCSVIPFGCVPRRWSAGCIEALQVRLISRAVLGANFLLDHTLPCHRIKHSLPPPAYARNRPLHRGFWLVYKHSSTQQCLGFLSSIHQLGKDIRKTLLKPSSNRSRFTCKRTTIMLAAWLNC